MPYKGADELESHEVDAATEGMTKITEKILKEFKNESERHIVILGAAMLEGLLMRLLQRSLVESPTENDTLFVGNGALSTFSARSDMAFRLGLITKRFLDALNGIRKVRNDFAHESTCRSMVPTNKESSSWFLGSGRQRPSSTCPKDSSTELRLPESSSAP